MQNGGDEKPFTPGVLFAHGIGIQQRGETLSAFGGPFCRWLQNRCDALAQSQSLAQSAVNHQDSIDIFKRWQHKLETVDWAGSRC